MRLTRLICLASALLCLPMCAAPAVAQVGAQYQAPRTLTLGERNDLLLDVNGNLKVTTSGPGTDAGGNEIVVGPTPEGTAPARNPVLVAGKDTGGLTRSLRVDATGTVSVQQSGTAIGIGDAASNFITVPRTDVGGSTAFLGYPLVFNGTSWDRQRGNTLGNFVINKGGASIATSQATVSTTAVLVAPARAGRQKVTVSQNAANQCAYGTSAVTLTTGFTVSPVAGATLTLDTAADLYAICAASTTIADIEQF